MIFRIIAALSLLLAPIAAQAETLVVTADRMIDVLNGETVDNPVVVVTDGRIVSVSSGAAPTDAADSHASTRIGTYPSACSSRTIRRC